MNGALGAAEIVGTQSQNIIAQAEHFIAYSSGGSDVIVGQQALHEIRSAPIAHSFRLTRGGNQLLALERVGRWRRQCRQSSQ